MKSSVLLIYTGGVVFGPCDPVAEACGQRCELPCDECVDLEAFFFLLFARHALQYDAHGVEVVDFFEVDVLVFNLLPAAIDRFGACFDPVLVAVFVEHLAHRFDQTSPYGNTKQMCEDILRDSTAPIPPSLTIPYFLFILRNL